MILIDTNNKVSLEKMLSFPLSEIVVNMLIDLSKHFLCDPNFAFLLKPGYKDDACVKLIYKDPDDQKKQININFILFIRQGNVEKNKYSIHIRFRHNNIHLVRLCMNGGNHKNKNKQKIKGSHIHIYDKNDISHAYYLRAYYLKDFSIFSSKDNLRESLKHFERFVHIQIPQNSKPQNTN